MSGSHPLVQIRHDLVTALAYQRRYRGRASSDALVLAMRTANDAEGERLRAAGPAPTPESKPTARRAQFVGGEWLPAHRVRSWPWVQSSS